MGGEELHDQDREDKEQTKEVPGQYHGLVEVFIKTRTHAGGVTGAVAGKVNGQVAEGMLSQIENHQADTEEAEPQRAALVAGGGVYCILQDGDDARY